MNKIVKDISQYKKLFSILSYKTMIITVLAKLPYTMLGLGIIICVKNVTNSIVIAGFSTACISFSAAFSSLIISKYCDIFGARNTIRFILPINILSFLSLFIVLLNNFHEYFIYISCIFIGISIIPLGSISRFLWISNSKNNKDIELALSYESTVDELLYVLGPALVGILASIDGGFTLLGVIIFLISCFISSFILCLPKTVDKKTDHENNISIYSTLKAIYLPMLSIICIGIFFGSMQVSITEIAAGYGKPSWAGFSYATIGISSAISALLLVLLPVNFKLWDRQIVFSILLFISTLPCLFITSLPWITFFMFCLGSFVGPCIVTIFSIGEFLSKNVSTQIAMASIGSSIVVGNSIGSSIAGKVAFAYNGNISIMICLFACIFCMFLGIIIKNIQKDKIKLNN